MPDRGDHDGAIWAILMGVTAIETASLDQCEDARSQRETRRERRQRDRSRQSLGRVGHDESYVGPPYLAADQYAVHASSSASSASRFPYSSRSRLIRVRTACARARISSVSFTSPSAL